MVDNARPAPTEWDCCVFIAVAETHGAQAAADRLATTYRREYRRQSVEKAVKRMEEWVGAPLFERHPDRRLYLTRRGSGFLQSARAIVTQYGLMRNESEQPLPRLACLPHHTHFVARAEDRLINDPPVGTEKVAIDYLPQDHRGESEFQRHAVSLLRSNVYQIIIGPRMDDAAFESTALYWTQLEVMVGLHHPQAEMSLTQLVGEYRMLVPPNDMRSRRLLETSIVEHHIPDPGQQVRVAGETYETATSVIRLRAESDRRADRDKRVVVVPSDVALSFKSGMEFGGRHADRFKWVPLYHEGADGTARLLQMEVCATVRRGATPVVGRIVRALIAAVTSLNDARDSNRLCGEPFRGQYPVRIPGGVPQQRALTSPG